jgi:hypothetical protein
MKQACINSPDKRTVVIAVNINIIKQYDEKKIIISDAVECTNVLKRGKAVFLFVCFMTTVKSIIHWIRLISLFSGKVYT